MVKVVYPLFKENILEALVDVKTLNKIKCALLDDTYGYDPAHEFYSVSAVGDLLGTAQILSGITTTNGEFETADATTTFTAITGTVGAIVLYYDGAGGSTDVLIYHDDTLTGLDLGSAGGDVVVTWDTSPSYIFKI